MPDKKDVSCDKEQKAYKAKTKAKIMLDVSFGSVLLGLAKNYFVNEPWQYPLSDL